MVPLRGSRQAQKELNSPFGKEAEHERHAHRIILRADRLDGSRCTGAVGILWLPRTQSPWGSTPRRILSAGHGQSHVLHERGRRLQPAIFADLVDAERAQRHGPHIVGLRRDAFGRLYQASGQLRCQRRRRLWLQRRLLRWLRLLSVVFLGGSSLHVAQQGQHGLHIGRGTFLGDSGGLQRLQLDLGRSGHARLSLRLLLRSGPGRHLLGPGRGQ